MKKPLQTRQRGRKSQAPAGPAPPFNATRFWDMFLHSNPVLQFTDTFTTKRKAIANIDREVKTGKYKNSLPTLRARIMRLTKDWKNVHANLGEDAAEYAEALFDDFETSVYLDIPKSEPETLYLYLPKHTMTPQADQASLANLYSDSESGTSMSEQFDGFDQIIPNSVQDDRFAYQKLAFVEHFGCHFTEELFAQVLEVLEEEYPQSITEHVDMTAINLTSLPASTWESIKQLAS